MEEGEEKPYIGKVEDRCYISFPKQHSAPDRQLYRLHLQLGSTWMFLQKYYICEIPWVRSLNCTSSQFQSRKRDLVFVAACWLGLDSCCKTQTESQTFLTLRHIKIHIHQIPMGRLGVGSVSLKPVLFPSVPLSLFPEASCTSLTARFLL